MATKRQSSVSDMAGVGSQAKARIKELEEEVLSLKKRLDELRKAKNTTITKREREIVEVGTPFAKRDSRDDLKVSNLEKKLQSNEKEKEKEIEQLRKKFAAEMEAIQKSSRNSKEQKCNHDDELTMLKTRIEELESDNAALRLHGDGLMERVQSLQNDLSLKEASWCQQEEQYKLQIQKSFGEKYKEWMQQTENKIKELQDTNELLRGYLKNKK